MMMYHNILSWFLHPWSFSKVIKPKGENEGASPKVYATIQELKIFNNFLSLFLLFGHIIPFLSITPPKRKKCRHLTMLFNKIEIIF